ncbi:MAG: hypothetical protein K2Z25_07700 [Beijerinckiaceae bacterium]|nr:hypothetical protein [Beijerinckiaceae bacterium]
MTSETRSTPLQTINSLRAKSFNHRQAKRTALLARALNVGHVRLSLADVFDLSRDETRAD